MNTTPTEPIPPPSAKDMEMDLARLHEMKIGDDGLEAVVTRAVYFWSLIRRCHAAETALANIESETVERCITIIRQKASEYQTTEPGIVKGFADFCIDAIRALLTKPQQ